MKKIIVVVVILGLQLTNFYSQNEQFDPILATRLQFLLDSIRTTQNYNGISAAAYIPGEGVWAGTSGICHNDILITPDMKFCVASITKTFIAALMLKLQELNILDLDDSLNDWLPFYKNIDSTISIRQLLNHTSGIYNFTSHPSYNTVMNADTGRYWTPEEILSDFVDKPYFLPGDSFFYSNTNYILAGMIIKNATDTSLSYNLRHYIFDPLNFNKTFFPREEIVTDVVVHGEQNGISIEDYPVTSWYSSSWAAGAVMSTAEDIVKWYRDLFDLKLINQSSLNQMLNFTPQSGYTYGLGVDRFVKQGVKFGHIGFVRGYKSYVEIDSLSKYTFAVMVNQNPANLDPVIDEFDSEISNYIITEYPNGTNFLKLTTSNYSETKRMVLIK